MTLTTVFWCNDRDKNKEVITQKEQEEEEGEDGEIEC